MYCCRLCTACCSRSSCSSFNHPRRFCFPSWPSMRMRKLPASTCSIAFWRAFTILPVHRPVLTTPMLIQATSPRPMINVVDSPEHVRIHTLRKVGISLGEVALVIHEKRMAVEPYQVYPIEG